MNGVPCTSLAHSLRSLILATLTHTRYAHNQVAIPFFLYLNNFAGPRAMEPVFTRDFIMAQFEKIASKSTSTAGKGAVTATAAYVPTPGKVPVLPGNLFARGLLRSTRQGGLAMASLGLVACVKPEAKVYGGEQ